MDLQNPDFPLSQTCQWICTWRWHSTESFPHKLQTRVLAKHLEQRLRHRIASQYATKSSAPFQRTREQDIHWDILNVFLVQSIQLQVIILREQLASRRTLWVWASVSSQHDFIVSESAWQMVACWAVYFFGLVMII